MNNKDFRAIQTYISDIEMLKERAERTDTARRKRGEKVYCSRLRVSNLKECYVINTCGIKGLYTIVIRYDNHYYWGVSIYGIDGDIKLNVSILTEHFIEQYRGRNNLYAAPIEKVLYDILFNSSHTCNAYTNRLGTAVSLRNNCCVPVEIEQFYLKKRLIVTTTFITCLNKQDTKVKELHSAAQEVDKEIKNIFCGQYSNQNIILI